MALPLTEHVAFGLQPPVFTAHEGPVPGLQLGGAPTKPGLHAQVRDPTVLVQVALLPQKPFWIEHSLKSVQVMPLPVKPSLHWQYGLF
jgi:hypothetical protein